MAAALVRKHESRKVADDAPSSGFGIAATFPDYKRVIVPFDDIDAAQSFGIFNAGYGRHRVTPANIGRAITSGPNFAIHVQRTEGPHMGAPSGAKAR